MSRSCVDAASTFTLKHHPPTHHAFGCGGGDYNFFQQRPLAFFGASAVASFQTRLSQLPRTLLCKRWQEKRAQWSHINTHNICGPVSQCPVFPPPPLWDGGGGAPVRYIGSVRCIGYKQNALCILHYLHYHKPPPHHRGMAGNHKSHPSPLVGGGVGNTAPHTYICIYVYIYMYIYILYVDF